MQTPVDEIKSRLDIVELIKEYTNLKQVGVNWKANCPFHNEKTPSFIVSQDKQVWHCFGCSEGGDMFTFIEKIENVDFMEALRILAQKANVELKEFSKKDLSQRSKLLEMHELACNFWQQKLFSDEGEKARTYLKERGFSKEAVVNWKIGYAAKSWDSLLNYLKEKGFTERELVISGLVLPGDKNKPYDRFRDRIIFPIFDNHGQIIAFTARILNKDEKSAKYINSPQTPIYDKGKVVYGLNFAKQAIKEREQVVLVEGNTDVISSQEAGVKNVVAVSGTALTSQQLELLKRYTDTLVAAFDQDSAGMKALERSIFLALSAGFVVNVALLPEGHDPDSMIKENVDNWRKLIAESVHYVDYYFQKVEKEFDLKDTQGKKKAAKVILSILAQIPDKVEQDVYLQKLSSLLHVATDVLRQALPGEKKQKTEEVKESSVLKSFAPVEQWQKRAEIILACLLAEPKKIKEVSESMPAEIWQEGQALELYRALILFYNQATENKEQDFVTTWNNNIEKEFESGNNGELVTFFETMKMLSDDLIANDVGIEKELDDQVKTLKRRFLQTRINKLQDLLAKKEDDETLEKLNSLLAKLSKLEK